VPVTRHLAIICVVGHGLMILTNSVSRAARRAQGLLTQGRLGSVWPGRGALGGLRGGQLGRSRAELDLTWEEDHRRPSSASSASREVESVRSKRPDASSRRARHGIAMGQSLVLRPLHGQADCATPGGCPDRASRSSSGPLRLVGGLIVSLRVRGLEVGRPAAWTASVSLAPRPERGVLSLSDSISG